MGLGPSRDAIASFLAVLQRVKRKAEVSPALVVKPWCGTKEHKVPESGAGAQSREGGDPRSSQHDPSHPRTLGQTHGLGLCHKLWAGFCRGVENR